MSKETYRMSAKLREELEHCAALANDGESHVVGDRLERILGYAVDENGNRIIEARAEGEKGMAEPGAQVGLERKVA